MNNNSCGELLVILSSAIALQIGANKTSEEKAVLGNFFMSIGDQLSLLASIPDTNTDSK